jgi:hypothetical protein
MQRHFLDQGDQKFVSQWQLILASAYSSVAVIVLLLAMSSAQRDKTTMEAHINPTLSHVVHVVR